MRKVSIGLVGSGFAAELHARAYQKVYGVEASIQAVASVDPGAAAFAARHSIPDVYLDYKTMLRDCEIDAVDICSPPFLHAEMIENVLNAGKHVACEKPLTGYFGDWRVKDPGRNVPRQEMLARVLDSVARLQSLAESSGRVFLYAENYVYAPAIEKCAEILEATRAKILFITGEESHSGSHAPHAARWEFSGGGSLIRLGCHPIAATIHLKRLEAARLGEPFGIRSVTADAGVATARLAQHEFLGVDARPQDVEDCASAIITFADGTKANITANDVCVGGVRNSMEIFTNRSAHLCNISPNNSMQLYSDSESGLEGVEITEKVGNKSGWQSVLLAEDIMRGYAGELQDFAECAVSGREPKSGFALAADTLKVVYCAYLSAQEGVRVEFPNP